MRSQFGLIVLEISFFIIALIAGYIFISMAYSNVNNIVGAMNLRQQIETSKILTDIRILSCSYDKKSKILSIYVGNYGNQFLNQSQTVLFLNGSYVSSTVSLVYTTSNTGYWGPNDIIVLNTSLSNSGLYDVTVVASNGVKASGRIYVDTSASTCRLV